MGKRWDYWFKFQWRGAEPVEIVGDFCFHSHSTYEDLSGRRWDEYTFVGCGWGYLLLVGLVLVIILGAQELN